MSYKSKIYVENRGITLIALIVSVIVLLILAGVAVSMISGQDGLFNKANTASLKTQLSQLEEELNLKFTRNMAK